MLTTPKYQLFEFIATVCILLLAGLFSDYFIKIRHLLMIFGLFYIFFIASKINLPSLKSTLHFPSPKSFLLFIIIPSIIWSGIIVLLNLFLPKNLLLGTAPTNYSQLPLFAPLILYPLFSVPLQEVIFRWFYVGRFRHSSFSTLSIILISSFVFGIVHLPSGSPTIFIVTLFLGLWWNAIYLKTGNLWYTIIPHAIIGNVQIWLSLYLPR